MDVFKWVTPKAFFFLDLYKPLRLFFFFSPGGRRGGSESAKEAVNAI